MPKGDLTVKPDIRIGVIGLGFGANHARLLSGMTGVTLAAVADPDEGRLATYRAPGHRVYSDHTAMLAAEGMDAVVVAVPASLHETVAAAAIEAGCGVLVEKPLARDYDEARRMVRAAEAAGVVLMPGHIERFNPAVIELARRIRDGEIGAVLQVSARRMSAMREREHGSRTPPSDVNVVHDSAIHDIDAIRYVLGTEVKSVFGVAQSGIVTPGEDAISAMLRFRSEGRPGSASTPPIASLEVNWLSRRRVRDLTVLGETGTLVVDYAAQALSLYRSPGEPPQDIPVQRRDQLEAELSAFVSAVRDGTPPVVTPQDGLAAVAIADAITASARAGRPVALSEVAG